MPARIFVSRKEKIAQQKALFQAGRILHDLFLVGPWRIDTDKLARFKSVFDFNSEQNIFEACLLPDGGTNDEFIYRVFDGQIIIIWNKQHSINTSELNVWPNKLFEIALQKLFDLLKGDFPLLDSFKIPNRFWLADWSLAYNNRKHVPVMKNSHGLGYDEKNKRYQWLCHDWSTASSTYSTVYFIIYTIKEHISQLPFVKEYLTAKETGSEAAILSGQDFTSQLLEGDHRRCQLAFHPQSLLEDSSQGHWDLYWPPDTQPDPKWYEEAALSQNYHGRDPAKDMVPHEVAIDFGTTGTVVAMRSPKGGKINLLRVGAQASQMRKGIAPSHFVNPTVLSIADSQALLNAWHDLPYRPNICWEDAQCSHWALAELPQKIASGIYGIKTWARGKAGDEPLKIVDQKKRELSLRLPPTQSAADITEDFETAPLNPIELYAFFLGLFLNNQMVDGGRIFSRYHLTFPAKFDRNSRDRILDGFRRGLLRSLPPSLIYASGFRPEQIEVTELACEPVALAAALLPLLKEEEELSPGEQAQGIRLQDAVGPDEDGDYGLNQNFLEALSAYDNSVLEHLKTRLANLISASADYIGKKTLDECEKMRKHTDLFRQLESHVDNLLQRGKVGDLSESAEAALIAPTEDGVAFGVFDFGGGTTDFAIGLYRLPTEEEEECEGWEEVIDILDTRGDPDLGGEELVRMLVFKTVQANMAKLLAGDQVIPFERPGADDHVTGGEEVFAKSVIARENSRLLGEKLRPLWENGNLDQLEDKGQISETFTDAGGKKRENLTLNVDAEGLLKLLEERIAQGVDKFFATFTQAFQKHKISPEVFHVILAGNSSQSPLVTKCFRQRIAKAMCDNSGPGRIVLHQPRLPDPADPEAITLKTGVAIGLLKLLPGLGLGMVSRQNIQEETFFPYTVGNGRKGRLAPALLSNCQYGEWTPFGKVFRNGINRFYYTDSPLAVTGGAALEDCREGELNWGGENFGKNIIIKANSPDSVVFALQTPEGEFVKGSEKTIVLKGSA